MNQKDINAIKIIRQQRERELKATGKTTKEWGFVLNEKIRFQYHNDYYVNVHAKPPYYVHANKKIFMDDKSGRFYTDLDMKEEVIITEQIK